MRSSLKRPASATPLPPRPAPMAAAEDENCAFAPRTSFALAEISAAAQGREQQESDFDLDEI